MKKKVVLVSSIATIAVAIMLVFSLFSHTIGAVPVVVKPDIEDSQGENFDDEGWGTAPSDASYTYYGDHVVDGNWYFAPATYFGVAFDTWEGTASLSLVGAGNSTFVYPVDEYFSFDYYLLLLNGSVQMEFMDDDNVTKLTVIHSSAYDSSGYSEALDILDNGHVNWLDLTKLITYYGSTGSPGWIRADVDADGDVDANDVSAWGSAWNGGTGNYTTSMGYAVTGETVYIEDYNYYHDTNGGADDPEWLHSYHQFDYSATNFTIDSAYEMSFDADTHYDDWEEGADVGWAGDNSWSNVKITTFDNTIAFLDNMTICTTPYDLAVHSVYPTSTASIVSDKVQHNISLDILNNSITPIFGDGQMYLWQDSGTETQYLELYAEDSHWLKSVKSDYDDAHDDTMADYGYISEDIMKVGQYDLDSSPSSTNWEISRSAVTFDTSGIEDEWIITGASLILYPETTDGSSWDFTGSIYAGCDVEEESTSYPLFPWDWDSARGYNYEWYADDGDVYTSGTYDDLLDKMIFTFDPDDYDMFHNMTDNDGNPAFRCLLRSWEDVQDYEVDDWIIFNSSRADEGKPMLRITYTVPAFEWIPLSLPYNYLYADNVTYDTCYNLYTAFDTQYYWYLNFTASGYSWEFPTSGTVMGDRYCYNYTTESYIEPTVTTFSPAHNAPGVALHGLGFSWINWTVDNTYEDGGATSIYLFNNVSKVWVSSSGTQSYQDGVYVNMSVNAGYEEDIYWYVGVVEDGQLFTTECPSSEQEAMYLHGKRCWKFTTESNTPPEVSSHSPPTLSDFNPVDDIITVNMTDANIAETIRFDMYIRYEGQWGNGTTDDFVEMIIEDNRPLVSELQHLFYGFNETNAINLSLDYDTLKIMLHDFYPAEGTNFSWRVVMRDTENTVYFPAGGSGWITYNFTLAGGTNSQPTIVVNYPTILNGYTLGQWLNNHDLSVTLDDDDGDDIYLYLDAYTIAYDYNMSNFPTGSKQIVRNRCLCDENLAKYPAYETDFSEWVALSNGTYTFDMSWFAPYNNQRYIFALKTYDDYHLYIPTTTFFDVTLGVEKEDDWDKMAVRSLNAYEGSVEGAVILDDGLNVYVAYDGKDYTNASDDAKPTVSVFLTEKGESDLLEWLAGEPHEDVLIKTAYQVGYGMSRDAWNLITLDEWYLRNHGVEKGREYTIFIGLYWEDISEDIFGGLWDNTIELYEGSGVYRNHIYDETMRYQEWIWETVNFGTGEYIITPPYVTYSDGNTAGDYRFIGFSSDFTTDEALQVSPVNIANTIQVGTNLGIGGLNYILAVAITACFLVIPYILIKKKARNVPLPVLASFGTFGIIFSFGLGLIELWIFIIPFILLLFILIYRIAAMIMGGANSLRGGDEGVS